MVTMALLPVCLLSFAVSVVFVLPGGIAADSNHEEIFVRSFELDSENCRSQVHCPRTLDEYANGVDQYFKLALNLKMVMQQKFILIC